MESLYTRLDALKREMLRENASVVGLGDDGDDVEVEDEEMREGQRRERRGTEGVPAPSPSIGVEEVTSRVTAQNAAEVLRRCDELEAMLIADSCNLSPKRAQRKKRHATRALNDAFDNFVYARDAQESRRSTKGAAASGNEARRNEAYEKMFPRPACGRGRDPAMAATDPFCCRARNSASSALYCPCPECLGPRRKQEGVKGSGKAQQQQRRKRAGTAPTRVPPQRSHHGLYDDVRTASHAAASAVKAAAETVRQGPGIRGAELAWRKERVALMREMGALRRHTASCEQQLKVLRQRTESREDEMRHLKALVKQRDELILEAEGRLQELQRLHAEELASERRNAKHAESTRDNLALVYRTSLLRLLNDRCDVCRAAMGTDDEIKSVFLDGLYDVEHTAN